MGHKQGKGARSKAKNRRKAARLAQKRLMKEEYRKRAELGINLKSIRFKRKKIRNRLVADERHATGFCGNSACLRCFPMMPPNPSSNHRLDRNRKPHDPFAPKRQLLAA